MFAPPRPPRDTVVARVVVSGALRGAFASQRLGDRAVGGLAALAARVDSLEAACRCPTFWVDAGGASYGAPVPALSRGALTVTRSTRPVWMPRPSNRGPGRDGRNADRAAQRFPRSWVAINASPSDAASPLRALGAAGTGDRAIAVVGVVDGTPPGASERTVAGCASVTARPPSPPPSRAPGRQCRRGRRGRRFRRGLRQPRLRRGGRPASPAPSTPGRSPPSSAARPRSTFAAPPWRGSRIRLGLTVVDVVQLADGGTAARARWIPSGPTA